MGKIQKPERNSKLSHMKSTEAVFVQHQAPVRWQIGRIVFDAQAVDDLAQEVFVAWFQMAANQRENEIGDTRAWLLRVARNKAIDWIRTKSNQPVSTGRLGELPDVTAGALEAVGAIQSDEIENGDLRLAALRHCVGLLSPEHREIVEEYYSQGKSSELIAVRIGKGSSGVRMMLTRIRRSLGKCVRRQLEKTK